MASNFDTREEMLHRRAQVAEADSDRWQKRYRDILEAFDGLAGRFVLAIHAREKYAADVRARDSRIASLRLELQEECQNTADAQEQLADIESAALPPSSPVADSPTPCAKGHEWSNQFGDDWTPDAGTPCDCRQRVWVGKYQPSAPSPSAGANRPDADGYDLLHGNRHPAK